MTIKQFLESWITRKSLSLAARTIESYRFIASRYIVPAIGDKDISAVQPDDIISLLSIPFQSGHARTAVMIWQLLRSAMPAVVAEVPRPKHRSKQIDYLSPDDAHSLLRACESDSPEWHCAFMLMITLGLRRGELCALRWVDVLRSDHILRIDKQIIQMASGEIRKAPLKSASSGRSILLPEILASAIRADYIRASAISDQHGSPLPEMIVTVQPAAINHHLAALLGRAGLPHVSVHGLRHTAASIAINNGIDIHVLQTMLGHSSVQVTASTYAHVQQASVRHSVDTISRLVL